jgi:hypothetical protein
LDGFSLQLSKNHHDHQHSFANGRTCVEFLHGADKIHSILLEHVDDAGKVQDRTTNPIQTIHNHPTDFSGRNVSHHLLKRWPVCILSAVTFICIYLDIFPYHFPPAKFDLAFHRYTVHPVH